MSEFVLPTRRAMRRFSAHVAGLLSVGDVVLLEGELGAGKTFFVRGVARALGVPSAIAVTSPTFAIVHELPARVPLIHADLYRLRDADEIEGTGLLEYVRRQEAVVLVEWGTQFSEAFGADAMVLRIRPAEIGRIVEFHGKSARFAAIDDRLRSLHT